MQILPGQGDEKQQTIRCPLSVHSDLPGGSSRLTWICGTSHLATDNYIVIHSICSQCKHNHIPSTGFTQGNDWMWIPQPGRLLCSRVCVCAIMVVQVPARMCVSPSVEWIGLGYIMALMVCVLGPRWAPSFVGADEEDTHTLICGVCGHQG